MLDINALPDDVYRLKRLLLEHHAASLAKDLRLEEKNREIEHLKWQLAKLRRARFGQSSEGFDGVSQLSLTFEELTAAVEQAQRELEALPEIETLPVTQGKPVRRKRLPDQFERVPEVIEPSECVCPDCGGKLGKLGTDETEILEAKTVTFTVRRQVRPKKRCVKCATIVQAPVPSRPIQKSFAGASLLALVLTWKYGFHLPLHRQCQIFAHAGLTLSRTTLMQWVAASSELLGPLVAALAKHVLAASNINADDTWVKVLAPGSGKTKTGHLWTYVRDGRPWGSTDPPAVWYQYSPSWHGKYPQRHLASYNGKLQVDAYAGFEPLFVPSSPGEATRVEEISCMAHARRKFFDVHTALKSPLAAEALDRIGKLYEIERQIQGRAPEERRAIRQTRAVPVLNALHVWMIEKTSQVDPKSPLMEAFNYSLNRWESLCRYTQDGRLSIDNNSAERALRGVGIGRKNYMFFGSDNGGDRAAILYSLIESCKLNGIDPQRYLHYGAPGQAWCFQRVKFPPRQEVQPPYRESSLESEEVTNRAKRRQSDARAVTKVKQFSLVKYLSAGRQHRIGWQALVGAPRRARWPETAAGSKCTARSEREASRNLGDPLRSWSALRADRVCRTIWLTPEKGRCCSEKSDSLVVLRARESRVHGEAAKQMAPDLRETSPAPAEAGA